MSPLNQSLNSLEEMPPVLSALCSHAGVDHYCSEKHLFTALSSMLYNLSSPIPTILPRNSFIHQSFVYVTKNGKGDSLPELFTSKCISSGMASFCPLLSGFEIRTKFCRESADVKEYRNILQCVETPMVADRDQVWKRVGFFDRPLYSIMAWW